MFTIFDGIFVGNGVNTEALAAVNMAFPFVMVANALFSLVSIGGVAISAIRLGQQDIIPSGLSMLLQFFGRNDGIPGLVGVATVVSICCISNTFVTLITI